jgi:hypothetical protein
MKAFALQAGAIAVGILVGLWLFLASALLLAGGVLASAFDSDEAATTPQPAASSPSVWDQLGDVPSDDTYRG